MLGGYPALSTSIPGVAQRTGSTSYVVEIFSRPRAESDGREPVFCLFPVPGALDVLLAPELLEVGRAIEAGFASPSRTTIIASTHRLYSIHEKMPAGDAVYPSERILAAARALSRRFVGFDALAVAREHGTEVNAVLLGALAAADVLPIGAGAVRQAIERKGVQVASNLKGFEVGGNVVRAGVAASPRVAPIATAPAARLEFARSARAFPSRCGRSSGRRSRGSWTIRIAPTPGASSSGSSRSLPSTAPPTRSRPSRPGTSPCG